MKGKIEEFVNYIRDNSTEELVRFELVIHSHGYDCNTREYNPRNSRNSNNQIVNIKGKPIVRYK